MIWYAVVCQRIGAVSTHHALLIVFIVSFKANYYFLQYYLTESYDAGSSEYLVKDNLFKYADWKECFCLQKTKIKFKKLILGLVV